MRIQAARYLCTRSTISLPRTHKAIPRLCGWPSKQTAMLFCHVHLLNAALCSWAVGWRYTNSL
jgi:hypothetical protein